MIDLSPMPFVNNSQIRVVKHDEARKHRTCPYIRFCRVMILAFPLDYQTMYFFKAAVAPFGRLISWHEGPNKSKSLLDCLVLTPERIPCSIVVSQGSQLGGNGQYWTASVYIIGGQFPDGFANDEDPIPVDGNRHPLHDHVLHANPDVPQNWMHDLVGAGAAVQADFGVQAEQMQDLMEEMASNVGANDNDAGLAEEEEGDMNDDPNLQQPQQQHDSVTFDQSGSTTQYLRANGPDIHLTVDMVLQGQLGSASNSSSSSSVSSVNSLPNEENAVLDRPIFQFGQVCQMMLPLQTVSPIPNAIPLPISLKRRWNVAFTSASSSNMMTDTSKAILPYKPCLHAVLLHIWAQKLEEFDNAMHHDNFGSDMLQDPVMEDHDIVSNEIDQQSEMPEEPVPAKNCLLTAFDTAATSTLISVSSGLPPKPTKQSMKLPMSVSAASSATPVMMSQVRRSPRLSKDADGFRHCRLEDMHMEKDLLSYLQQMEDCNLKMSKVQSQWKFSKLGVLNVV